MKTELFLSMLGERLSLSKKCYACTCKSRCKRILSKVEISIASSNVKKIHLNLHGFGVMQNALNNSKLCNVFWFGFWGFFLVLI